MTSLARAASIDDLRKIAMRRLPTFAFDFVDGGAEDESNLRRNRSEFERIELVPRYLVGASGPGLETAIFKKSYAVPFGMAPMGFLNMAWPGADMAIARLAAQKRMPLVVSSASSTGLEEIAAAADGNVWFQIYVSNEKSILNDLLRRCNVAGYEVLVVTVDVAQPGKRDRDIRNGLQIPFRPDPRTIAELILHPRWSFETLMAGAPGFGNFEPGGAGGRSLADIQKQIISSDFKWDDLRRLRDKWQGPLLLKGILHPDDATRAVEEGCDGIIVSNHGGRQVDYGPASIAALPAIAHAIGDRVPLILDSGIRRGADIVRAKALGASFVLAGRAFAYGVAAGSDAGANAAFNILETELSRALGQLGFDDFVSVDDSVLARRKPLTG